MNKVVRGAALAGLLAGVSVGTAGCGGGGGLGEGIPEGVDMTKDYTPPVDVGPIQPSDQKKAMQAAAKASTP